MYSQCPKCQAIFSVSETDIGAHHGLVRCGHCNSVFHALTNEVGDVHGRPGVDAPGETGNSESSPGEQVEAEYIPHSETGDDTPEETGSAESFHGETDRYPHIEEERDWEGTAPLQEDEDRGPQEETWSEPVPPESRAVDEQPSEEYAGLPGEITEEITIEAPPVLWNVFDEEFEKDAGADESTGTDERGDYDPETSTAAKGSKGPALAAQPKHTRKAPRPAAPEPAPAGKASGRRAPLRSLYRGSDIRMVELPQPRPFKTATLSLVTVLLALLLVWQAKTFYLDNLAQVPVLRPYLEQLCRPLDCVLPPRRAFAQIDLVGTRIDVNPEIPGALEITVSLINRAHFSQPYPPLRVTLSDREGRVVGRRTYLPSEYRQGDEEELLPTKEVRDVSIKLAQPAEDAVGYEVELMAPGQSEGG